MAETYQIEMNLEQLERLLKNLPEGIMLEICFGKEDLIFKELKNTCNVGKTFSGSFKRL